MLAKLCFLVVLGVCMIENTAGLCNEMQCGACARDTNSCGWCSLSASCYQGSSNGGGSCSSSAGNWYFYSSSCPTDSCLSLGSCSQCQAQTGCGWCSSTGVCSSGSISGPNNFASCPGGWNFGQSCANPCSYHTNCATCTADSNSCGWCSQNSYCYQGSSSGGGPCTNPANNWFYSSNSCPFDSCSYNTQCLSCQQQAGCGWCGATQTCSSGNAVGPTGNFTQQCGSSWTFNQTSCPTANDPCSNLTNCYSCSAAYQQNSCGWCPSTNTCGSGTYSGPNNFVCPTGWMSTCPTQPCSAFTSCGTCSTQSGCGWCDSTQTCAPGSYSGLNSGTCSNYYYSSCPTCSSFSTCGNCLNAQDDLSCIWCQQPGSSYGSCFSSANSGNCYGTVKTSCTGLSCQQIYGGPCPTSSAVVVVVPILFVLLFILCLSTMCCFANRRCCWEMDRPTSFTGSLVTQPSGGTGGGGGRGGAATAAGAMKTPLMAAQGGTINTVVTNVDNRNTFRRNHGLTLVLTILVLANFCIATILAIVGATPHVYISFAIFYLIYCVECVRAHTYQFIRNTVSVENIQALVLRLRLAPPQITAHVCCYHYETRTRTVSYTNSDGSTGYRTETYTVRVDTHRAQADCDYESWHDDSGPILGCEHFSMTKVNFSKSWGFEDSTHEAIWDDFCADFRRRNDLDTHQEFWVTYGFAGYVERILALADASAKPKYLTTGYYLAFSCFLLSWPYRKWLSGMTARTHHTIRKVVSFGPATRPIINDMDVSGTAVVQMPSHANAAVVAAMMTGAASPTGIPASAAATPAMPTAAYAPVPAATPSYLPPAAPVYPAQPFPAAYGMEQPVPGPYSMEQPVVQPATQYGAAQPQAAAPASAYPPMYAAPNYSAVPGAYPDQRTQL